MAKIKFIAVRSGTLLAPIDEDGENAIKSLSNEESYSVKKAKNRIKYRFRLRIYKKLWLYSLLLTDYLKDKIK